MHVLARSRGSAMEAHAQAVALLPTPRPLSGNAGCLAIAWRPHDQQKSNCTVPISFDRNGTRYVRQAGTPHGHRRKRSATWSCLCCPAHRRTIFSLVSWQAHCGTKQLVSVRLPMLDAERLPSLDRENHAYFQAFLFGCRQKHRTTRLSGHARLFSVGCPSVQ